MFSNQVSWVVNAFCQKSKSQVCFPKVDRGVVLGPHHHLFPFALPKNKNTLHRITALLTLAILCMALELAGLLSGYTIHQKKANIMSALAHLGGFLSTLSMVLNGWTVRVYPYVFTVCRYVRAINPLHVNTAPRLPLEDQVCIREPILLCSLQNT